MTLVKRYPRIVISVAAAALFAVLPASAALAQSPVKYCYVAVAPAAANVPHPALQATVHCWQ
jgi:hypothetical protein